MEFKEIENLSEIEILEEYDEILSDNWNSLISGTIWKTDCSNGVTGYFVEPVYKAQFIGEQTYGVQYLGAKQSISGVCGNGVYGRTEALGFFDDNATGALWITKCSNGVTGYFVEDKAITGYNAHIGDRAYNVQYTGARHSISGVCGNGVYGYTEAIVIY